MCLHAQEIEKLDPVLLVGRRLNVNWTSLMNGNVFLPDDVSKVATSRGQLFHDVAQDFFIVHNNSFPWQLIPDVVVGRVAYDNFVVARAIATNVSVIDVTKTVVAVHQSDNDGDRAGHNRKRPYRNINRQIIGKFRYSRGRLNFTQYYTEYDVKANASVRTKAVSSRCRTDSKDAVTADSAQRRAGVCIFAR
jgi:hypothetical protein